MCQHYNDLPEAVVGHCIKDSVFIDPKPIDTDQETEQKDIPGLELSNMDKVCKAITEYPSVTQKELQELTGLSRSGMHYIHEFERKSSMSIKEKAELIVADIKKELGTNPVLIFKNLAKKEYVSINGPEHHILDGASLLMAYKNAGGEIDIDQALDRLMAEGLRMPGAMCGLWGICGAITSIGAALAIIDGTGPLSTDGTWGSHMQFTSKAIGELGIINGPRCCKRDAMIAFKNGVDYVNAHYDVTLQYEQMKCEFTELNEQCIKDRCPFYAHSFQQEY